MINQNKERIYPEPFGSEFKAELQSRRIAIFDLDGTLVNGHLWSGLMKYFFKKKQRRLLAIWHFIFHMAYLPLWKTHLISKEKYWRIWAEGIPWMIKGIELEQAKEIFNWLSDKYLLPTIKNNAFEKLKWHQGKGDITILASNCFQELVDVIANRLKISFAIGARLGVVKNKFSGRIIPPLPFGEGKANRIKELIGEKNLDIDFKESFSYSDSIFDLPMLELVGHPAVVDPDEELLKIAKDKGWTILKT